jgi:two-component system sensor histidine kinase AtoS
MPLKDTKTLEQFDVVESEIKTITHIINDMLNFSRMRKPIFVKCNINDIVKEIISHMVFPKEINVEYCFRDVPLVMADIEEIRQVVRNIINNALDSIKDSGNGKLNFITGKTVVNRGGNDVEMTYLEIKDTGCGIKEDILPHIFDPFYTTKFRGTGLGLAVVYRIIKDRHDGVIEVKSHVGLGTSMSIKIPSINSL